MITYTKARANFHITTYIFKTGAEVEISGVGRQEGQKIDRRQLVICRHDNHLPLFLNHCQFHQFTIKCKSSTCPKSVM